MTFVFTNDFDSAFPRARAHDVLDSMLGYCGNATISKRIKNNVAKTAILLANKMVASR